jgi:hypothetical protein
VGHAVAVADDLNCLGTDLNKPISPLCYPNQTEFSDSIDVSIETETDCEDEGEIDIGTYWQTPENTNSSFRNSKSSFRQILKGRRRRCNFARPSPSPYYPPTRPTPTPTPIPTPIPKPTPTPTEMPPTETTPTEQNEKSIYVLTIQTDMSIIGIMSQHLDELEKNKSVIRDIAYNIPLNYISPKVDQLADKSKEQIRSLQPLIGIANRFPKFVQFSKINVVVNIDTDKAFFLSHGWSLGALALCNHQDIMYPKALQKYCYDEFGRIKDNNCPKDFYVNYKDFCEYINRVGSYNRDSWPPFLLIAGFRKHIQEEMGPIIDKLFADITEKTTNDIKQAFNSMGLNTDVNKGGTFLNVQINIGKMQFDTDDDDILDFLRTDEAIPYKIKSLITLDTIFEPNGQYVESQCKDGVFPLFQTEFCTFHKFVKPRIENNFDLMVFLSRTEPDIKYRKNKYTNNRWVKL